MATDLTITDLQARVAEALAEAEGARAVRDAIVAERDELKVHLDRISTEAAAAAAALAAVIAEREDVKARLACETAGAARARMERDRLATHLEALTPGDVGEATGSWREPAPHAGPLRAWSTEDVEMRIATELAPHDLRSRLTEWSPWRMEIIFSNGVRTSELETKEPFTLHALNKMAMLESAIDLTRLSGGTALDIGFNCGYNAFHLASNYGMEVDAIDIEQRHLEVARFLSEVGNFPPVDFMIGDAQTFERPDHYDLVLHFGTLYHLPNPVQSLTSTARNLKPGGYLSLETTCFSGSDERQVKYIRGYFGDTSNFWALSKPVLEDLLELHGFEDVMLVHEVDLHQLDPGLSRALYVARKGREQGFAG